MKERIEQLDYYLCETTRIYYLVKENESINKTISVNISFSKQKSEGFIKIDSLVDPGNMTKFHSEYHILETGNLSENNCIFTLSEIVLQHLSKHSLLLFMAEGVNYKFKTVPCIKEIVDEIKKAIANKIDENMEVTFSIDLGNEWRILT